MIEPDLTKTAVSGTRMLLSRTLVLTALGPLYNDILLFRVAGFAVTPVHLLLAVTVIAALMSHRHVNGPLALVVSAMILLELSHALLFGFPFRADWVRSFAQYLVYATAFVLITGAALDRADLQNIAPWVRKCAVVFSGLGIVQFLLNNSGFGLSLPGYLRVKAYDPFAEARTGGFVPAQGLAMEPSYYAVGLVLLLALVLFFDTVAPPLQKPLSRVAVLMLVAGIATSFSMTGIISAGLVIFVHLASSGPTKRIRNIIMLGLLLLILAASGIVRPIGSRLNSIARGADNSALVRIELGVRVFFAPARNLETFFLGTGLGLEARNADDYFRLYRDVALIAPESDAVRIHNILTALRFLQGWLGVLLYGILMGTMLLVTKGEWRPFAVLLSSLILFHFAAGLYLAPGTWAAFALWTVLRRSQLSMSGLPEEAFSS
jgi:hypothetical protein